MPTMEEQNKEWMKQQWHKRFVAASGNQDEWQKIYSQYLKSDIWKEIRLKAIERAGFRCERCKTFHGSDKSKLQIHHKHGAYDRVGGFERDSDLQVVCAGECHQKADIKREQIVEQERLRARYQARFNAWGRHRYKSDWDRKKYDDELGAEEEFHKRVYKDWCDENDVHFDPSADVPELFIDLLKDGREDEYEGMYGY